MKSIFSLFIITAFLPMLNMAQIPMDSETSKYTYKEIVEVNNASKKELYTRAKLWLITNLASQESQMNYYNEEAGTVIANGHFNADFERIGAFVVDRLTCDVSFTIKISTKDGKYRYEITNFTYLIVSWNLIDDERNISPLNHTRQPLESGLSVTTVFSNRYKSNTKALTRFLHEIDRNVKEKIASLSQAMKVGVLDNDDW